MPYRSYRVANLLGLLDAPLRRFAWWRSIRSERRISVAKAAGPSAKRDDKGIEAGGMKSPRVVDARRLAGVVPIDSVSFRF